MWHVTGLPSQPGRGTQEILAGANDFGALVVGGVELADFPDPVEAAVALDSAPFLVSLEIRRSAVTDRADVVFPVAPVVEKAGTFLNWEGRHRAFEPALRNTGAVTDSRVLHMIADEMGVDLGLRDVGAARDELRRLSEWGGARAESPDVSPGNVPSPGPGQAVLASWRMLLDNGRLQDGEPYLAGTARRPVARLSPATAAEIGAADGDLVKVRTEHGSIALPLNVTDMAERVVWVPMNSPTSAVHQTLRVTAGAVVSIEVAR